MPSEEHFEYFDGDVLQFQLLYATFSEGHTRSFEVFGVGADEALGDAEGLRFPRRLANLDGNRRLILADKSA